MYVVGGEAHRNMAWSVSPIPCAVDHWSLKKLESPEHSSNSGFTCGRLTELQLDAGGNRFSALSPGGHRHGCRRDVWSIVERGHSG